MATLDPTSTGDRMVSGALAEVVQELLKHRQSERQVKVLDLGGGTGVYAVPMAKAGHPVTVVDQSPDALATLRRRANAAGVGELVTAVLSDLDAFDGGSAELAADVVLCHRVLEYVDNPVQTLIEAGRAVRAGGVLSIVSASRFGAILSRVLGGRCEEARALLDDPDNRVGGTDQSLRRFEVGQLTELLGQASLSVISSRGVGLFEELTSRHGTLADNGLAAALDRSAPFVEVAPYIHLLAQPMRQGT